MSRFEDEIAGDESVIFTEAGDLADYQGGLFSAFDIYAVLDRGFEVHDEDQVPMHVTTISVLCVDVPTSRQGDTIVLPERAWTVQEILQDDGRVRRLWVS